MIQDLSQTLKAILTQPGLPSPLGTAQIAFDRPTETFAPTTPAIDLFLYDLRENLELRNNEPIINRSNGQVSVTQPPLRLACSYLVTAWPGGTGEVAAFQEHQLLSQVLQLLSKYPTIPPSFLKNSLVGQEPPLPMIALHPDALKNLSEFWTSLGNKLRPSLTATVTIAMSMFAPEAGPMVITEQVSLQQLDLPGTQEVFFRIGGQVTDAQNKPVGGASVTLLELGLTTKTEPKEGRYSLGPISSGTYTLRAQSGATVRQVTITVPATAGKNYNVQLP